MMSLSIIKSLLVSQTQEGHHVVIRIDVCTIYLNHPRCFRLVVVLSFSVMEMIMNICAPGTRRLCSFKEIVHPKIITRKTRSSSEHRLRYF